MLTTLRRYLRAFVLALRFTLRGEKPPLLQVREQQPQLVGWWQRTLTLIAEIEAAAATQGIDMATIKVHADKRDVSMKTILATVRFHAEREYPYLIVQNDQYSPMTLQALNLNDRYLVMQLAQHVTASLRRSVEALNDHLGMLPATDPSEV
ncbi:MAG: hypothetical protein GC204_15340 [Chloroflexi bacterium]|nr:hypothetical protein [Chloroflexota bacterium]